MSEKEPVIDRLGPPIVMAAAAFVCLAIGLITIYRMFSAMGVLP